jgi:heat shock protein HslJ
MRTLVAAVLLAVAGSVLVACSSGSGLTGKAWQWTASTTQNPTSQSVVPDPENYTIQFNSDGTFNSKADCNQVSGTYTTSGSNGLVIVPGPSTMAFCGEDSSDTIFLGGISTTQTYAIANGQLTLNQVGGGTMTFR